MNNHLRFRPTPSDRIHMQQKELLLMFVLLFTLQLTGIQGKQGNVTNQIANSTSNSSTSLQATTQKQASSASIMALNVLSVCIFMMSSILIGYD
ncbi:hypothetical protein GCK32_022536 [Trichostrongylus colubriformis]|uniref:Uncharacterized protein n=1 Tax=Trichostrongylus colubriformis TaxID=6319 RepID=A0AAN8IVZ5_TRICO